MEAAGGRAGASGGREEGRVAARAGAFVKFCPFPGAAFLLALVIGIVVYLVVVLLIVGVVIGASGS